MSNPDRKPEKLEGSVPGYLRLLESLMERGYRFSFFSEDFDDKYILFLRHDIDFDVEYAHEMATLEADFGVKSTYFFLIRSNSYNVLEKETSDLIIDILNKGHEISIHFDPTIYEDIHRGLEFEVDIFRRLFHVEPRIISIHRPCQLFIRNSDKINGLMHTYQPMFMEKMVYFSDSRGWFSHGAPIRSEAFREGRSMQLLIHPIWWMTKAEGASEKIEEYKHKRHLRMEEHVNRNCFPFDREES